MANRIDRIHPHSTERVAILLNANARAVSDRVRNEIAKFVPAEDIFYSRSLDDAQAIARTVVARGYSTVLVGGGDGTFVGFLNAIHDRLGARHNGAARGGLALALAPSLERAPRLGLLKLGTGNSLASVVGASGGTVGVVEDVQRARTQALRTRQFELMEVEGRKTIFAGVGLDALVLNEYIGWKRKIGSTALAPLASGGAGYFFSISLRSIPRYMRTFATTPQMKVTHTGETRALQIAPDGKVVRVFQPGEVIYQGPAVIAAAGTIPCYGFGFKIFPHAGKREGLMHLRMSSMGLARTLWNVPKIWKGRTPANGVFDALVDSVHIEFDRLLPFQIGGDAEGWRREIDLGMSNATVEVVDYTPEVV